jgi:predicted site-specific integrase-resolvase
LPLGTKASSKILLREVQEAEFEEEANRTSKDASQGRAGIFSRKSSAKQRQSLKIEVKLNQPIVVVNQQSFNIQLFATKSGQRDPP